MTGLLQARRRAGYTSVRIAISAGTFIDARYSAARGRPTLGIDAMAWLIKSQVRTSVRIMRVPGRWVVVFMGRFLFR
jgi:hypothetical protein